MDLKTKNSNKKAENGGNSNQKNRKCNQKDVKTRNCNKKLKMDAIICKNIQN